MTTKVYSGRFSIVADSDDTLQVSVPKLETFTYKYGFNVSASTTKRMAFKGLDSV
jgi:hypothetical protein